MKTLNSDQKQDLITEMLDQVSRKENEFPIIRPDGSIGMPLLSVTGIVLTMGNRENLNGYKGYALEVNDHGNVTVWSCFKNGNRREIASRV